MVSGNKDLENKFVEEKRVRGTGTIDPQQMLIFRELLIFRITKVGLIFLVSQKRLTYHAAITDGIACRRKH